MIFGLGAGGGKNHFFETREWELNQFYTAAEKYLSVLITLRHIKSLGAQKYARPHPSFFGKRVAQSHFRAAAGMSRGVAAL